MNNYSYCPPDSGGQPAPYPSSLTRAGGPPANFPPYNPHASSQINSPNYVQGLQQPMLHGGGGHPSGVPPNQVYTPTPNPYLVSFGADGHPQNFYGPPGQQWGHQQAYPSGHNGGGDHRQFFSCASPQPAAFFGGAHYGNHGPDGAAPNGPTVPQFGSNHGYAHPPHQPTSGHPLQPAAVIYSGNMADLTITNCTVDQVTRWIEESVAKQPPFKDKMTRDFFEIAPYLHILNVATDPDKVTDLMRLANQGDYYSCLTFLSGKNFLEDIDTKAEEIMSAAKNDIKDTLERLQVLCREYHSITNYKRVTQRYKEIHCAVTNELNNALRVKAPDDPKMLDPQLVGILVKNTSVNMESSPLSDIAKAFGLVSASKIMKIECNYTLDALLEALQDLSKNRLLSDAVERLKNKGIVRKKYSVSYVYHNKHYSRYSKKVVLCIVLGKHEVQYLGKGFFPNNNKKTPETCWHVKLPYDLPEEDFADLNAGYRPTAFVPQPKTAFSSSQIQEEHSSIEDDGSGDDGATQGDAAADIPVFVGVDNIRDYYSPSGRSVTSKSRGSSRRHAKYGGSVASHDRMTAGGSRDSRDNDWDDDQSEISRLSLNPSSSQSSLKTLHSTESRFRPFPGGQFSQGAVGGGLASSLVRSGYNEAGADPKVLIADTFTNQSTGRTSTSRKRSAPNEGGDPKRVCTNKHPGAALGDEGSVSSYPPSPATQFLKDNQYYEDIEEKTDMLNNSHDGVKK